MNKDAKQINPSTKGKVQNIKVIAELRKEGIVIAHDKAKCRYYNPATISHVWGYNGH